MEREFNEFNGFFRSVYIRYEPGGFQLWDRWKHLELRNVPLLMFTLDFSPELARKIPSDIGP